MSVRIHWKIVSKGVMWADLFILKYSFDSYEEEEIGVDMSEGRKTNLWLQ